MPAHNLTHEHLQTIIAAEHCRSMGAIALTIHASLPTISRRCTEIEEIIGQTIFVRKKNNLALTGAGQILLEYAKANMQLQQSMIAKLDKMRNEQTELQIGASPSVTIDDAIVVADELFMRHQIVTHIREAEPAQLIDMIQSEQIEIALLWGNHHVGGINFNPYKREDVVILTQDTHPLAMLDRPLNFEETSGALLIDIVRPSVIGGFIRKIQESTNTYLQTMMSVASLEAAGHAVAATSESITITIGSIANRFCKLYPHLQKVMLRDSWATVEYHEAYADIGAVSSAGIEFLRYLKIRYSERD